MGVFIATFVIIGLAIFAMAIGTLLGRSPIKGSCGGLNQVGLSGSCGGACNAEERDACALHKKKQAEQHS